MSEKSAAQSSIDRGAKCHNVPPALIIIILLFLILDSNSRTCALAIYSKDNNIIILYTYFVLLFIINNNYKGNVAAVIVLCVRCTYNAVCMYILYLIWSLFFHCQCIAHWMKMSSFYFSCCNFVHVIRIWIICITCFVGFYFYLIFFFFF